MRQELLDLLRLACAPSYPWGPGVPFAQMKSIAGLLAAEGVSLHGKRFIELDSPPARPLSLAALIVLIGAECGTGVGAAMGNPSEVAVGLYWLLLALSLGRLELDVTRLGTSARAIRGRIAEFAPDLLLDGDLRGVPARLQYRQAEFVTLPVAERRFDLLVSYSGLARRGNVEQCLAAFRESISAAGLIYLGIDYRDERTYTAGGSPWDYMVTQPGPEATERRRLRHSAMVALLTAAGFRIAQQRVVTEIPPASILSRITAEYRDVSMDDLATNESHLLLAPV